MSPVRCTSTDRLIPSGMCEQSKLNLQSPPNYHEEKMTDPPLKKGHNDEEWQLSHKRYGIPLALLCAFLGSFKGWLVGLASKLEPLEVFGCRSLGSVSLLLPMLVWGNHRLLYDRSTNCWLFTRAIFGNVAVAGYYYGFAYLPMADASLIFYSTPIYTSILGCLLIGEPCGLKEMFSIFFSCLGVALVTGPKFLNGEGFMTGSDPKMYLGLVGCLVGALAQAVAFIILRKLRHVPALVVSFWWASVGCCTSLALTAAMGRLSLWSCGVEGIVVLSIAGLGFLGELSLIASLALSPAGPVSVALTTEILWAFVLQTLLQNKVPLVMSLLGALCILASIIGPLLIGILGKAICANNYELPAS